MMHHQNAGSKGETTVQTIMQQMQWTYVIGDAKKTFVKKSHQSMGIDLSYTFKMKLNCIDCEEIRFSGT
jgi:hypothetical protein